MTEPNLYAAPKVQDLGPAPSVTPGAQPLYAVGIQKLVVLSVATFGLYMIHWMERQWRFHQRATGEAIMPLARGLFSVFFVQKLFRIVHDRAWLMGLAPTWKADWMAALYIVTVVLSNIGRYSGGFSVALIGAVLPLVVVQRTINQIVERECPEADMNEAYSVGNYVVLVIAVIFWGLVFVGMMSPASR